MMQAFYLAQIQQKHDHHNSDEWGTQVSIANQFNGNLQASKNQLVHINPN